MMECKKQAVVTKKMRENYSKLESKDAFHWAEHIENKRVLIAMYSVEYCDRWKVGDGFFNFKKLYIFIMLISYTHSISPLFSSS